MTLSGALLRILAYSLGYVLLGCIITSAYQAHWIRQGKKGPPDHYPPSVMVGGMWPLFILTGFFIGFFAWAKRGPIWLCARLTYLFTGGAAGDSERRLKGKK